MAERDTRPPTARSSGRNPVLAFLAARWVAVVIVVLAVVFIAQNQDVAVITFLFGSVRAPIWFVLALLFLAGLLAGYLLARSRPGRRG